MNGADYIATGELYGKKGRFYKEDGIVAVAGYPCAAVDPESLPWLLEQGYIVPKPAPTPEGDE
jgi:hypothetical protein